MLRRSLFTGPKPKSAELLSLLISRGMTATRGSHACPLLSTLPLRPLCLRQHLLSSAPARGSGKQIPTISRLGMRKRGGAGGLTAPPMAFCQLRLFLQLLSGQTCPRYLNQALLVEKKAGEELKPLNHTGWWVSPPSFSTEGLSQALPGPAGAVQARLQLIEQEPDERYRQGPTTIPLTRYLCASYLQNLQLFRRPTRLRH